MKKIILASATLISAFALCACSDDSGTSASDSNCAEGLSTSCLKGTWNLSDITGTTGNAGKGTISFTKKEFRYTPAEADMTHTYCPGTMLSGTYTISKDEPGVITFEIEGLKMKDCFLPMENGNGSYNPTTHITTMKVKAQANDTQLQMTGNNASPFVPNDEGGKTEVYARQVTE